MHPKYRNGLSWLVSNLRWPVLITKGIHQMTLLKKKEKKEEKKGFTYEYQFVHIPTFPPHLPACGSKPYLTSKHLYNFI